MAAIKPAFFRPVEITSDNDTLSVYDSGSWTDVTIDHGVYATIKTVLNTFYDQADEESLPVSAFTLEKSSDDTDIRVKLTFTDTVRIQAPSILGWYGNESPSEGTTFTSTMRPEFTWVPRYQVANQDRFFLDQKSVFSGTQSRTGTLAGIGHGTANVFYRQLDFVNELATNVSLEACTSGCEANRCAELFFWQCRTVTPSISTYDSPRGFYFYPDWTYMNTYPGQQDTGSIQFDYTTNPSRYVFCQCDKAGYAKPVASLPTTRERYSMSLEIHTIADGPTWSIYVAPIA